MYIYLQGTFIVNVYLEEEKLELFCLLPSAILFRPNYYIVSNLLMLLFTVWKTFYVIVQLFKLNFVNFALHT